MWNMEGDIWHRYNWYFSTREWNKRTQEIFQKYKTQANLYNKNAVGLGLYLSKEIIDAHNGTMVVHSYPNNTNIFGFSIPIK